MMLRPGLSLPFPLLLLLAVSSGMGRAQVQVTGTGIQIGGAPSAGASSFDVLSDQKATGTGTSARGEWLSVTSGQTVTLLNIPSGAGYVSQIFLAFNNGTAYASSVLKVTVNGDATPAVSATLRNYFENWYNNLGSYWGNRFFSFNSGGNYGMLSTLPIPFNSGVTVTLTPSANSTLWYFVAAQTGVPDSWPQTRKLWTQQIEATNPATTNGVTYTPWSYETLLNYAGSNPGRLMGLEFFEDASGPGMGPPQEGDFAIFVDQANWTWTASTAVTLGTEIMDPHGNFEVVTTAGTTGSSEPTFPFVGGLTTSDGSAIWTSHPGQPLNLWLASAQYLALGMSIIDPNGNVETITTTGTVGLAEPTFCSTPGCTTADGTAVWTESAGNTMVPAALVSSGSEDFFGLGFNFAGAQQGTTGNGGTNGVTWNTSNRVSAYRFFMNDPIRFAHSISIIREIGDSSENPSFGSNVLEGACAYFYTQDTN